MKKTNHFAALEAQVRRQLKDKALRDEVFATAARKVLQSMVAHRPSPQPWNTHPTPVKSSDFVFDDALVDGVAGVIEDELTAK